MQHKHKAYIDLYNDIAKDVHETAKSKGWWDVQSADEWYNDIGKHKKYFKIQGDDDEKEALIAAYKAGQQNPPPNIPEKLMLIVSELAEAMEGLREGDAMSKKLPQYKVMETELADVEIRIKDLKAYLKLRVAEAEIDKAEYNKTREHKHGGKKF